jgi:hypothetical protein
MLTLEEKRIAYRVLNGIGVLLSKKEHWTINALARDASGANIFSPTLPRAVSYCPVGAGMRVLDTENIMHTHLSVAMDYLADVVCPGTDLRWKPSVIAEWNNRSTHEKVLAGLETACNRLAKEIGGE